MVVVLLPLLSQVLRLSPSQVHNYTCCKLIPILQYGDESALYYSHIFQHYSHVILAPGYLYYVGSYARIMGSSLLKFTKRGRQELIYRQGGDRPLQQSQGHLSGSTAVNRDPVFKQTNAGMTRPITHLAPALTHGGKNTQPGPTALYGGKHTGNGARFPVAVGSPQQIVTAISVFTNCPGDG